MRRGSTRNRLADFWFGIPLLNLAAIFRRRARHMPARPARIGVMCSPALGDTLLFSAVLLDLRAHYRRLAIPVHIVHICMPPNLAAAEMIEGADARLLIELTHPLAAIRRIRQERFDAFFDFTSWQRLTAFCTLMSGASFTAGFQTAGQHRGGAYDLAVRHRNDQHELENFRDLLRALAIPVHAEPAALPSSSDLNPLPGEQSLTVFHPWASGGNSPLREWPEERWLALAHRLADPGTTFVITGGPGDRGRVDSLVDRFNRAELRAAGFIGSDGFRTLVAILRRARLTVSVNTGVMHLSAIVGAPTISLNGPTSNSRWGPLGRCVRGVQPADGSGGYLHLGFEFEGQPADVMERITLEQVEAAARDLLERCAPVSRGN